jgi:hypothetical protein
LVFFFFFFRKILHPELLRGARQGCHIWSTLLFLVCCTQKNLAALLRGAVRTLFIPLWLPDKRLKSALWALLGPIHFTEKGLLLLSAAFASTKKKKKENLLPNVIRRMKDVQRCLTVTCPPLAPVSKPGANATTPKFTTTPKALQ